MHVMEESGQLSDHQLSHFEEIEASLLQVSQLFCNKMLGPFPLSFHGENLPCMTS